MGFVNYMVNTVAKKNYDRVQQYANNPLETQQKILNYLTYKAKDTEFGKQHHFNKIRKYQEFVKNIPVNDYEALKPFIERVMKGEQNLLWSSEINYFAKSSGTTSDKSKFIPVSEESLLDCHYRASKDLMGIWCTHHPNTNVFMGKPVVMGGFLQSNPLNQGSFYGDVSAVVMANMPFLWKMRMSPSQDVLLMEKWEEKIEQIAQNSINDDITNIIGVPTWTLVLLKRILEITGKSHIKEVWPNLEMYTHGGVSFVPYKEQFQELIPDKNMQYYQAYNATEGFFGIQCEDGVDDMLLMLNYGIYYEFIPMEEWGKENPICIPLQDVEVGKNYAIVISTSAGLWRYQIGDTVEFTSTFPFRIKVSGRTKQFINVFGEEVMVDNTDKALAQTSKKHNAVVTDYSVAPIFMTNSEDGQGGHEWIIEFQKEPENITQFTTDLDKNLQEINSDYEAKRYKNMALNELIVQVVPPKTFYKWMESRGKLGGQNKVPRLSNERNHVESIKKMFEMLVV